MLACLCRRQKDRTSEHQAASCFCRVSTFGCNLPGEGGGGAELQGVRGSEAALAGGAFGGRKREAESGGDRVLSPPPHVKDRGSAGGRGREGRHSGASRGLSLT